MDLLKINSNQSTANFYHNLAAKHLLPIISRPTRITGQTFTLLDNKLTNIWNKLVYCSIVIEDISDHLHIIAWFDCKPFNFSNKPRTKTFNLTRHRKFVKHSNDINKKKFILYRNKFKKVKLQAEKDKPRNS